MSKFEAFYLMEAGKFDRYSHEMHETTIQDWQTLHLKQTVGTTLHASLFSHIIICMRKAVTIFFITLCFVFT